MPVYNRIHRNVLGTQIVHEHSTLADRSKMILCTCVIKKFTTLSREKLLTEQRESSPS